MELLYICWTKIKRQCEKGRNQRKSRERGGKDKRKRVVDNVAKPKTNLKPIQAQNLNKPKTQTDPKLKQT